MSSVLATCEFPASNTNIMPDQSALRSVDLQLGHTFPVVMTLHFLHAFSFAILLLVPPFFLLDSSGLLLFCATFGFLYLFSNPFYGTKKRLPARYPYLSHARSLAKAYSCYPCPNFGSDLQGPRSLICYNDSLLDITLKVVVSNLREVEKGIRGSYPYKCPKVRDFDYFAFNYLLELWIKRKGLKSDFVICGAVASDQLAN